MESYPMNLEDFFKACFCFPQNNVTCGSRIAYDYNLLFDLESLGLLILLSSHISYTFLCFLNLLSLLIIKGISKKKSVFWLIRILPKVVCFSLFQSIDDLILACVVAAFLQVLLYNLKTETT